MAIESPLFQSSMELFGHSITHFNGTRELDRKLVILHLSNSVELILKDIVLDAGASIYKNPKETITIHGSIETLESKSISIPYRNKLEMLFDERNALQHRFGSPNELTVIFYMNVAMEFFRAILRDHYGQDVNEVLTQFADEADLAALRVREPMNESELEGLKKLGKVHPLGALLSAVAYLERVLMEFGVKVGIDGIARRPSWFPITTFYLERHGLAFPEKLRERLDKIRKNRNLAAHGRVEPTLSDVRFAVESIEELESYLSTLDVDSVIASVEEARLRRREEQLRLDSSRVLLPPDQWMHETLKNFLMTDPSLSGEKFMIDVREGNVSVSRLPATLSGEAEVFRYGFQLNDKGDNIVEEGERIKKAILNDSNRHKSTRVLASEEDE